MVPLQFLMEQQGYNVMTAQRGEDALDLIYQYKPDLVLLDIMLPGIDGYEVCEIVRLNPNYRDVKIIFLTAKAVRLKSPRVWHSVRTPILPNLSRMLSLSSWSKSFWKTPLMGTVNKSWWRITSDCFVDIEVANSHWY